MNTFNDKAWELLEKISAATPERLIALQVEATLFLNESDGKDRDAYCLFMVSH